LLRRIAPRNDTGQGKGSNIEGNHDIGNKYMGNHKEKGEKIRMNLGQQKRQERLYDKDKNLST
jgi:hypothetical protein